MALLSGIEVANFINEQLRTKVQELARQSVIPTLSIVRVGKRDDDIAYERSAVKRCKSVGIAVKLYNLNENITQEQLVAEIEAINRNPNIHGCLIFRPLPSHLNDKEIRRQLLMTKDVDGITDGSMAAVFSNSDGGFVPCTAQSCMELLDYYGIELSGKNAVVVGRSLVIGKPVSMLLLSRNATVTVCHTKTKNLAELCKKADILIAAAGRAKMITKDFVSPGQIVVDVGINADKNGDLCGDVDFASVEPIVGFISPVPKGVGPVTTSVLAKHVVTAAEKSVLNK